MSKTAPAAAPAQPDESSFPMALEEFCSRLSASDNRVELIGAFAHSEKAAGKAKDTDAAYAARYAKFANQPA